MDLYNNIKTKSSIKNKKWNSFANWFTLFRKRASRGESHFKEISFFLVLLAFFTVRGINLHLAIIFTLCAFIGLRIAQYTVGYFDEKKLNIWQREEALSARLYNPVTSKIDSIALKLGIRQAKPKPAQVYSNSLTGMVGKYKPIRILCNWYILYRSRVDRGESYYSDFQSLINYGVVTGALLLPDYLLPFLVIIAQAVFYFIGWFDETRLGLWQMQMARTTRVYNPVMAKLDKIEKKLKVKA